VLGVISSCEKQSGEANQKQLSNAGSEAWEFSNVKKIQKIATVGVGVFIQKTFDKSMDRCSIQCAVRFGSFIYLTVTTFDNCMHSKGPKGQEGCQLPN
jgi:hypothetical protein